MPNSVYSKLNLSISYIFPTTLLHPLYHLSWTIKLQFSTQTWPFKSVFISCSCSHTHSHSCSSSLSPSPSSFSSCFTAHSCSVLLPSDIMPLPFFCPNHHSLGSIGLGSIGLGSIGLHIIVIVSCDPIPLTLFHAIHYCQNDLSKIYICICHSSFYSASKVKSLQPNIYDLLK